MISAARTTDALSARTTTARTTTGRGTTRQITIRSTQMSHLMHEELARAHLNQRLEQAEQQRLAAHVVRLAKARRQADRARRRAEQAQLRLRLLTS